LSEIDCFEILLGIKQSCCSRELCGWLYWARRVISLIEIQKPQLFYCRILWWHAWHCGGIWCEMFWRGCHFSVTVHLTGMWFCMWKFPDLRFSGHPGLRVFHHFHCLSYPRSLLYCFFLFT
jgi:hypothetical protein